MKPSEDMAQISQITNEIIDPLLRNQAGIPHGLIQSWEEIIGPHLSDISRPEKIIWTPYSVENKKSGTGVLVVACQGMAALRVQHQTREILHRINSFLGYAAIEKIYIIQKPVLSKQPSKVFFEPLEEKGKYLLMQLLSEIQDISLRRALEKLGTSIKTRVQKVCNTHD